MAARSFVNGKQRHASIEPRTTLADFVCEQRSLTGTSRGCAAHAR
jgi:aerobic-type carbon monoxide dehydrogenase small subunit (CoxS/CutS family)